MIKADFHLHSRFSSDSKENPKQIIHQAIKLGLTTICFTDHMDYEFPGEPGEPFIFEPGEYQKSIRELQQQYAGKLDIRVGVELGLRNEADITKRIQKRCTELVSQYPFDFVIGSTHILDMQDPYRPEYWAGRATRKGLEEYFQANLENIRSYDCYDTNGHMDYAIRYAPLTSVQYSFSDYKDLVDETLRELIHRGKALEVNTGGRRKKNNELSLRLVTDILIDYRALGGELITVGSDAHIATDLTAGFSETEELLRLTGFRYYTVYRERRPEMVELS